MVRKTWTTKEICFIKKNYGILSLTELSQKLDRSIASIKHKAEREGIKSPRQWTEDEINYIKENYRTKTYKELSEYLKRSKAAIDLKINKLGLKKSKYTYDHDFFSNIITEEQAYWCGFIMADGCVTINKQTNSCELCIKLQARDGTHLQKFNKSIQGNLPIEYREHICNLSSPPTTHTISSIRLYSQQIVHDISKYGVIPNKSLIKQFPNNIPNSLMSHYIRGYFDGNGSIVLSGSNKKNASKKYISCTINSGSYTFVNGMKSYLEKQGISSGKIYSSKTSQCHVISVRGMQNVDNFLRYIYSNSSMYLDRKFKKVKYLYEITNMEQRLLRQSEKIGQPKGSSEKENGKAEMPIRVEGCVQKHSHTQSVEDETV